MKRRSKAQRRKWWNSLTPEQQAQYIEKKVQEKMERRKNKPPRPQTGFAETGVNDETREEWKRQVKKMNPWLKDKSFEQPKLWPDDLELEPDSMEAEHLRAITA